MLHQRRERLRLVSQKSKTQSSSPQGFSRRWSPRVKSCAACSARWSNTSRGDFPGGEENFIYIVMPVTLRSG